MSDRLLIGVLGHRNSGKSTTWNTLFGQRVKTGTQPRRLILRSGDSVEVFLVSGSPEERELDVELIIGRLDCRIVLCSIQYVPHAVDTFDYFIRNGFSLHVHWLNPGYQDRSPIADDLGLMNYLLDHGGTISLRDGQQPPAGRVQEIGETIHGWATYRNLIIRADAATPTA
jgi:hypothetical protein